MPPLIIQVSQPVSRVHSVSSARLPIDLCRILSTLNYKYYISSLFPGDQTRHDLLSVLSRLHQQLPTYLRRLPFQEFAIKSLQNIPKSNHSLHTKNGQIAIQIITLHSHSGVVLCYFCSHQITHRQKPQTTSQSKYY